MNQEKEMLVRTARRAIDGYLPNAAENAALAQEFAPIMRPWVAGTMENPIEYVLNDLRTEDGVPYKCTNPHTHHGEEKWNPAAGTSLWRRYHGTSPETAWEFTADGANPYLENEYCLENGKVYRCKENNVVHAPSVLPDQWEAV